MAVKISDGFRLMELSKTDDRTLQFTASSESEALRYDWMIGEEFWEVLGHEPDEVDLERLRDDAVPMLWNHDVDRPLGLVKNYEIANNEGMATALWGTDEFAQQKKLNVDDGTLKKASIRYRIKEMQKVGERDLKPIMRATKWELIEVSLTPLPVDSKVGVGVKRTDEGEYLVRSESGRENNLVPLDLYEVPLAEKEQTKVAQSHNLRYYLPEGNLVPSRCVMAFEAAASKALQINDDQQAKIFIEENISDLSNLLRSYYGIDYTQPTMNTQPPKPENSSITAEFVEQLRTELQKETEQRSLLQTSYEQLKSDLDTQNLRMRYRSVRSAFEKLKDVEFKITPAQFDQEFGTLEEDDKKIVERSIGDKELSQLEFLYNRYSRLEARTLGSISMDAPKVSQESLSKEKEDYELRATSAARSFNRSIEKSVRVL